MADVVSIGDVTWYHHLTGSNREIQTPQDSSKNLTCEKQKQLGNNWIQKTWTWASIKCHSFFMSFATNSHVYFLMWHVIVFLNSTGFKGQSAETKTSHFPLLTKSMINKET